MPLDLFLLAGQSNMAGRGRVEAVDMTPHPRVFMLTREGEWAPAREPMHFDKPEAGVGPGLAFARLLVAENPDARVGLVPCAVGGSPISTWAPGVRYEALGVHPFDDMRARVRRAGRDGVWRGVLWHQGESDTKPGLAEAYEARLRELVAQVRAELGEALSADALPFLIGQIGRFAARPWTAEHEAVDRAQRTMAGDTPNAAFVSSAGLRDGGDGLHFDAASARELGARYHAAFRALTAADAR